MCSILPSFGVSDFYIFCECLYVICSFRQNFRKSNVLNLKKLEQKSQIFRESIVFEKQIPICVCASLGVSFLWVPGVPCPPPPDLADQLTLSESRGADYGILKSLKNYRKYRESIVFEKQISICF